MNEEYDPHTVSELICVKCGRRWIGVYPSDVCLKNLKCPNNHIGFVILTGQDLDAINYQEFDIN